MAPRDATNGSMAAFGDGISGSSGARRPSSARPPRKHGAEAGALPWSCWALLFFFAPAIATGCAPGLSALKKEVDAKSEIVVVYGQGSMVTSVAESPASSAPTPEAYRAIADTVRDVLELQLSHQRVVRGEAGSGRKRGATGLEAMVSVHGGYRCDGGPPEYGCGLTVQSRITFRSLRTGRIVGPRDNVIGQVWYGRHPLVMEKRFANGGETGTETALAAALRDAIHREVPATVLLGPLASATEEGLAVFLKELRASGE